MVHQKNNPVHFIQPTGRTDRCVIIPPPQPGAPTEVRRFKAYYDRDEYHQQLRYKEIVHRPLKIDMYKEIVHRPLVLNYAVAAKNITNSQFKGRFNF